MQKTSECKNTLQSYLKQRPLELSKEKTSCPYENDGDPKKMNITKNLLKFQVI
jgi:hypothetical protein